MHPCFYEFSTAKTRERNYVYLNKLKCLSILAPPATQFSRNLAAIRSELRVRFSWDGIATPQLSPFLLHL